MKSPSVMPHHEGQNTPDNAIKLKSILRKSTKDQPQSFRVVTRASTMDKKVLFRDPIHELHLVEPIIYKMPKKDTSCTCAIF
ncbi:unnamed protein product [Blepharisma stoltei]|uniref:Uncharacterized protein n=1 Tax=Blepharisma stoltei TaxID=1481888 RepID=A0AAU9KAH8_9CILI|nr:unnamed protein product [Blepharisma stoltei]